MDDDIDILARTVYGEARGEGYRGMQAVANVVMNRVALADQHPHFGDGSPAAACKAPWQFSCWNPNDPNLTKIESVTSEDTVFAQAFQIANDAIKGLMSDITFGATFYYVKSSPTPNWAEGQTPCQIIGKHLFYKNIA